MFCSYFCDSCFGICKAQRKYKQINSRNRKKNRTEKSVIAEMRISVKERFETFTVLINRISRNIRKIKNGEMSEYNLRSSHISCLYYLYLSDGLTATDLCERCEEDKATISRSLDYLEKNGYLICESYGTKRYKSAFNLTDKGLETGKKLSLIHI